MQQLKQRSGCGHSWIFPNGAALRQGGRIWEGLFLVQREAQARETVLGIVEDEGIRSLHLSKEFFPHSSLLPVVCPDSAVTDTTHSKVSHSNSR